MKENNLYPIFLKLEKVQTLIVGGGNVGLEKVQFILNQSPNAKIKIVSEDFHPQIIELSEEKRNIQLVNGKFISQDLEGVKILIVATGNYDLNFEIYQLAQAKNILTNVVDNPSLCDFYTAAVTKKGPVKVAVSSNGSSPTLAKRVRDILQEVIPEEVEDSALMLEALRSSLKGDLEKKIKILNSLTAVLSVDLSQRDEQHIKELIGRINSN